MSIYWTTRYSIPSGGSVQIVFPTKVPKVYPHCRSMTNLGSKLVAEGSTNNNGEVGCLVQTTNSGAKSWVITGFEALGNSQYIRIVGRIDYPNSNGYLGAGEIITYNMTDATNIRANGFIIDYQYDSDFDISLNNVNAQNGDSEMVLEETLPLRVGHTGPLRFMFTLNSPLQGPNIGTITIRLPLVSTLSQSGGFSLDTTKKHVCQIVQVSNWEETGCIVTNVASDNDATFPNFVFTMITSS